MAHITRIKASDSTPARDDSSDTPKKPKEEKHEKVAKQSDVKSRKDKKAEKLAKKEANKSSEKKPFILIRPFVAFGRYLRDSWRELRQVRWPNRKTTWKMVLAVFVYTALFIGLLVLLDILFDWIFSLILK